MKRTLILLSFLASLGLSYNHKQVVFNLKLNSSSSTLDVSHLTYLGAIRIPNNGADVNYDNIQMTGRRVGSSTHLILSQNASGQFVGAFSPIEYDVTGLTPKAPFSTAPFAAVVRNYGFNGGPVDTYQGLFGKSYDASGTPYTITNPSISGLAYHDNGSGHCCLYVSYALPYGIPTPEWNLLLVDLDSTTVAYGVWRTESGEYPYGSGIPDRGAQRAFFMTDSYLGKFCHGGSNGATQQGNGNQGPSLFCSDSWPVPTTPSGFGTQRTTDGGRSTDLVATHDYLAHYDMGTFIGGKGAPINGQPIWSARRPKIGSANPYIFEDGWDCLSPASNTLVTDIDPVLNNGLGSWTRTDGVGGFVYINTGTVSGWIFDGSVSTKDHWYETPVCQVGTLDGGLTSFTFNRNADEIANGGGPLWCPLHNVDPGIIVTGPVSVEQKAMFMFYRQSDLGKTPDYTPDPSSWAFWNSDISPDIQLLPNGPHQQNTSSIWVDTVTMLMYIVIPSVDNTSTLGNFLPVIQVFKIN